MSNQEPIYDNSAFSNDPELNRLIKEAEAAGEISAELDTKLNARIEEICSTAPDEMGAMLVEHLKADTAAMLEDRASIRAGFLERQREKWGTAFDRLRALLEAVIELGGEFNVQYAPAAANETDYLFDALRRLHARACLLSNEVLWMMEGGFASGAMARWRTLHEISVVAFFLKEHGQSVAERYLLHDRIDTCKAARQYQTYCGRLGREPLSAEVLQKLEEVRNDLCVRFGRAYGEDWGWASQALGLQRPSFADIERSINLDHMRPYFKLACYSNHAGSKGLRYDLGNALVPVGREVLLAGPSDAGFFDPGYSTAISLFQVTVCLLTHHVTITTLVTLNALDRMVGEVEDAFADAEAKLEEEANRRQAADAKDLEAT